MDDAVTSISDPGLDFDTGLPSSDCHLPDGVVKNIASYLVNETASTLSLLAMCGVCKQFRSIAHELADGICLAFEGFDNTFINNIAVQRFRKLPASQKEEIFVGAAKLFIGYDQASFSGDGVTDVVLKEVGQRVGRKLVRLKMNSTGKVTDDGLLSLINTTSSLTTVVLEDLSKSVTGKFLVPLLERCENLQTLHLSNIPTLSWAACKMASLTWPEKKLTKLHIRGVNLEQDFGVFFTNLPHLAELEIDGHARNIRAAALSCPKIHRISYQVSCRPQLEEALQAMAVLKDLKQLELIVKNFTLVSDQLRVIGMLPLVELRLDSFIYKQQPTLSRSSYSHVDNEGVKALVDSICNRWCASTTEMKPLKLSLCGATALTHDAVSALLRLPVLTELDIGGCCRIIAMDKMRLVAKVRAGREMLESGRRPSARSSRFPGLFM